MRARTHRRGVTTTQVAVVLALITLAIVATVSVLGNNTRNRMTQISTDVGNPSSLTTRFGS